MPMLYEAWVSIKEGERNRYNEYRDGNKLHINHNQCSRRIIRGFCIGKANWHLIDTIDGAKASAIIYSIAETAKANHMKPYKNPKTYGRKCFKRRRHSIT